MQNNGILLSYTMTSLGCNQSLKPPAPMLSIRTDTPQGEHNHDHSGHQWRNQEFWLGELIIISFLIFKK